MDAARREPEPLEPRECIRLLRLADVGHLALSSGALPMIVPVNYSVGHDVVLVRTTATARLKAATDQTVVAFEANGIDDDVHAAWTVTIAGIAREATTEEQAAVDGATLPDWIAPDADRVIAISLERIAGQRIQLQDDRRAAAD